MRYKEFNEDKANTTEDKFFDEIIKNCQPFLKEMHYDIVKNTLYRGMTDAMSDSGYMDSIGLKTARLQSRTPKDTSMYDHDRLNAYFEHRYGHPYRNGVFATGSISVAASYGEPMSIFPVGKFDYIWHDSITDLYADVLDFENDAAAAWIRYYEEQTGRDIDDSEEDYFDWVENTSPVDIVDSFGSYHSNEGLAKAVSNNNPREIMLWTKEYYYMQYDLIKRFQDRLNSHLQK